MLELLEELQEAVTKQERLNALLNVLHSQYVEGSRFKAEIYDCALFELCLEGDKNQAILNNVLNRLYLYNRELKHDKTKNII